MEYFALGTLDRFMSTDLRENDARNISSQLLEGLKIMHEEGFTHRDLKPQVSPCAFNHGYTKSAAVMVDFLNFGRRFSARISADQRYI